jgi:hypothetical protein
VLTEAGMGRVTAALPGHLAQVEEHLTGRFTPGELARFLSWLRDIRDDLNPGARPSGEAAAASSAETAVTTGRTGGRNRRSAGSPMDLPRESVNGRR